MAATLVDLTGFTFGIGSEESGINVESISIKASSKTIDVPNKGGETTGRVFYDAMKEITVAGETTASFTTAIGATVTVANIVALGGVSTGGVYLEDVTLELKRDGLQRVTYTAKQYPGVT